MTTLAQSTSENLTDSQVLPVMGQKPPLDESSSSASMSEDNDEVEVAVESSKKSFPPKKPEKRTIPHASGVRKNRVPKRLHARLGLFAPVYKNAYPASGHIYTKNGVRHPLTVRVRVAVAAFVEAITEDILSSATKNLGDRSTFSITDITKGIEKCKWRSLWQKSDHFVDGSAFLPALDFNETLRNDLNTTFCSEKTKKKNKMEGMASVR